MEFLSVWHMGENVVRIKIPREEFQKLLLSLLPEDRYVSHYIEEEHVIILPQEIAFEPI